MHLTEALSVSWTMTVPILTAGSYPHTVTLAAAVLLVASIDGAVFGRLMAGGGGCARTLRRWRWSAACHA
jgi:hypothetical protein